MLHNVINAADTYFFPKIIEMEEGRTSFNLCLYKCRWGDLTKNNIQHATCCVCVMCIQVISNVNAFCCTLIS